MSYMNTYQLNSIMTSFQDPDFFYMGTFPCDDLIIPRKSSFRFLAAILNTDPNGFPGKHWVAILIDTTENKLEYFDSSGRSPNDCLMKTIRQCSENIWINPKQHQFYGSNCGVYACFFIIMRIYGITCLELNTLNLTDNMMTNFKKLITYVS